MELPENQPILSKKMLAISRVIAKGRRIRDVDRLVRTYGGKARNWTKNSTMPVIIDGRLSEIHWYECHGIGKVEIKVKQVSP